MSSRNNRLILIAILALSVLLRVGVALYLGDSTPPGKDETSYSELAARLANGYGYSFDRPWYPFAPANTPTAHWSFLYTAFVAAIYSIAGVHPWPPAWPAPSWPASFSPPPLPPLPPRFSSLLPLRH